MSLVPNLKSPTFNAHYEGEYDQRMVVWRRLGARDKASNLEALLGERPVGSVLEVGCGTGAVLSQLRNRGIGSSHIGVDVADPDKHLDSALDLRPYDGETLPFEDNSFDLVYASHVLEHVLDERQLLNEMARVGKLIYVEVPCELNLRTDYNRLQDTLNIGHINAYTPHSFGLTLVSAGLKVIDLQLFDHSNEVHAFNSSKPKAWAKAAIRRPILKINPALASKIFTYHAGALCEPA